MLINKANFSLYCFRSITINIFVLIMTHTFLSLDVPMGLNSAEQRVAGTIKCLTKLCKA
jgi:hypothetical protein